MQAIVGRMVRVAIPDFWRVVARFPLAVLAAAALTAFLLLGWEKQGPLPVEVRIRVPAVLAASFLWVMAAALLASARGWSQATAFAVAAAGFAAIVVLIALADMLAVSPGLLIAGLALLLALAGHMRAGLGNAALWLFNHQLWIGALVALVAVVLFAGGVSLIFESLRYLFGLPLPTWLHEKVWIIALFLVAPLNWLALVPTELDAAVEEGEQSEFSSRAVAMVVRYVLVPLLLVFAVILHAYALKIAVQWSLPRGQLGTMVLLFGAVLVATAFAAFPTRNAGGTLVALFWRIWPWLLPVPLLLLFIAVWLRIGQHGLTEARYFVVLAGLWLTAVVVTQAWRPENRDLRVPVGLLALLLAIASFGPWGMMGASTAAQVAGLSNALGAAGLLRNGRVIEAPQANTRLTAAARTRVNGAIVYLSRNNQLDLLRPLFAGVPDDPFAGLAPPTWARPVSVAQWTFFGTRSGYRSGDRRLAEAILKRLGLSGRGVGRSGQSRVAFSVRRPLSIDIEGRGRMIGELNVYRRVGNAAPVRRTVAGLVLALTIENGGLNVVETTSGRFARFDLDSNGDLIRTFRNIDATGTIWLDAPLRLKRSGGDLDAELLAINASAERGDGEKIEVRSLNIWMLLAR